MNRYLSFRRMGHLLVKDLSEGYRGILVVVGALTGIFLLNYLLNGLSGSQNSLVRPNGVVGFASSNSVLHMTYFALTLFIGGFIITSRAFLELHTTNRSHDWLMLPASPIEKYFSRLVLTSAGVAVGMVVYFALFSLFGSALMLLLFHRAYVLFNPLDGAVWLLVLNYVVLQSIFFAGAVYFKKLHFIKTVLVLAGFGLLLVLVTGGLAVRLFWGELLVLNAHGAIGQGELASVEPQLLSAGRTVAVILRIAYWGLLAPVFWIVAYFRLREAEVRNGV